MGDEFEGAVNIFDGLFLGDKDSSQDIEFITSNKVTHIINVASGEVSNEWVNIGVKYLTYDFRDKEEEIIFDQTGETFINCYEFIERSLQACESVLVHSVKGESRSAAIILSYLMYKFKWSLSKCLEYLNSRKPDCRILPNFLIQLMELEKSFAENLKVSFSETWESKKNLDEEVLSNTFFNSKPGDFVKFLGCKKKRKKKIRWVDGFIDLKQSVSRKSNFSSKFESKKSKEIKKLKPCIKRLGKVLENISKSLNKLGVKKDNDCLNKEQTRNNSTSKTENSGFFKERGVKIKKKIITSGIEVIEKLRESVSSARVVSPLSEGRSWVNLNCRK